MKISLKKHSYSVLLKDVLFGIYLLQLLTVVQIQNVRVRLTSLHLTCGLVINSKFQPQCMDKKSKQDAYHLQYLTSPPLG